FVVLVLLVPRTLSSSLRLPYTTLFRSETGGPTGINTTTCDPRPGPPVAEHHPPDDRVSCDSAQCPGTPHASERSSMPSTPTIIIDRKSTRLNSSHVSISYAVFCLKKTK